MHDPIIVSSDVYTPGDDSYDSEQVEVYALIPTKSIYIVDFPSTLNDGTKINEQYVFNIPSLKSSQVISKLFKFV